MNFGRKGGAGSKQRRKEKRNYIAKWQKGNEIMAKREANTIDKAVEKCMEKEPTEIKNCPFCGGHTSFVCRNTPSGSVEFAKCECDDCHAVIGVGRAEIVELVKELCIAKWNRRVSDDAERKGS
jgi:Lar family restriction alleviation protein